MSHDLRSRCIDAAHHRRSEREVCSAKSQRYPQRLESVENQVLLLVQPLIIKARKSTQTIEIGYKFMLPSSKLNTHFPFSICYHCFKTKREHSFVPLNERITGARRIRDYHLHSRHIGVAIQHRSKKRKRAWQNTKLALPPTLEPFCQTVDKVALFFSSLLTPRCWQKKKKNMLSSRG